MYNILETLFEMGENNRYKQVMNRLTWMFMFIAPSYLGVFLYKRDMFYSLDNIKLVLLCVILNSLLIFLAMACIYSIVQRKHNNSEECIDDGILKETIVYLKTFILAVVICMIVYFIFVQNRL